MADPHALHEAALALLEAIDHVTVYDGDVAAKPPADTNSFVLPYLVLWSSAGHEPEEAKDASQQATTGLSWTCQVTCVGGTQARALQAAHLARTALLGAVLVSGAGGLREDPGDPGVLPDRDVSPPRFFVPLRFTCLAL